MGWFSIHSGWSEPSVVGWPFAWRRCGFVGKLLIPFPIPPHPPRLCHTIKNCEWEKMDCSLPSHSVVLLLDGIIRPRWQAGRQETSSSSIWPSGRWSGPQVSSLGSLQMCLMLLLFGSCFLPLQGIFTRSHFGPEELSGSYWRRGSYIFPSWVIFCTKKCRSKGIHSIASGPSPWRHGILSSGRKGEMWKQIILCPYSSIPFYSSCFFPIKIKF